MEAYIIRLKDNTDLQTLGRFYLFDGVNEVVRFVTLELPWEENERSISRIPSGTYKVKKRKSKKFGDHFHILDVPGRDYILIHPGNYYKQIRGCVLLGQRFADINNDKELDVVMSRPSVDRLLEVTPNTFQLTIIDGDA